MNNKFLLITIALSGIAALSKAQTQLTTFAPKTIIGGMGQVLTISGSKFGNVQGTNYVSFFQESGFYLNSTEGLKLNYISWSDSKIELEMPVAYSSKIKVNIGGQDFFSSDSLKVKANLGYINPNPLDYLYLNNQNYKGGYTWYIHRTYWENSAARTAIEDVFKELRCRTGANYILASQPSDAPLTLSDTINLIAPDPSLGAVGYNDKLWSSCIVGVNTLYITKSLDIRVSTTQDWYFGSGKTPAGKVKFRYVLLHELGHSLGLGHVNEYGQTMFPSVSYLPCDNWNQRDSITTEEKTAISYFVKLSKNFTFRGCGITPLSPLFDCKDVYGLISGIESAVKENKLILYPNPGHGLFTIKNEGTGTAEIQIVDALGKMVYQTNVTLNPSASIDLLAQTPGIYYVRVLKNNSTYSNQKIVILK